MRNVVTRFAKNDEGAALVEYGLLVGLIAVACATAIGLASTGIQNIFTAIGTYLTSVSTTAPF
jgi:pilus assembly protein Flp/PilA